jgi:hypothetical protein
MGGSVEDEILERALAELQQENLSGRVRGALEPAVGKQPPNPNQLIAQGYEDELRQGLNQAQPALQEVADTAAPMQQALLQQIEDDKYSKFKK